MDPSRCTCSAMWSECDAPAAGAGLCDECAAGCRSWGTHDAESIYHYAAPPGWRSDRKDPP